MTIEARLEKLIADFTVGNCGEFLIKNQSYNFVFKKDGKVTGTAVVMRTDGLPDAAYHTVDVIKQLNRLEQLIGHIPKPVAPVAVPVEYTEPVVPVEYTEPVVPVEYTEPVVPVEYTEPVVPVVPTAPVVEPIKSIYKAKK